MVIKYLINALLSRLLLVALCLLCVAEIGLLDIGCIQKLGLLLFF